MKIFLLSILLLFFNLLTNTSDVYICVSKTATKYHLRESCKGLSNYTHVAKKESIKEAKEKVYSKLCDWEN